MKNSLIVMQILSSMFVSSSCWFLKKYTCMIGEYGIFSDEEYKDELSGSTAVCVFVKNKRLYCVSIIMYGDYITIF